MTLVLPNPPPLVKCHFDFFLTPPTLFAQCHFCILFFEVFPKTLDIKHSVIHKNVTLMSNQHIQIASSFLLFSLKTNLGLMTK